MEAVSRRRGCDSVGMARGLNSAITQLQFSFQNHHNRATFFASIRPRSRHDRATIGRRSWHGWLNDHRLLEWRRFHHVISPIAARSRRDRGVLPQPLHAILSIFRWLEGWRDETARSSISHGLVSKIIPNLPILGIKRELRGIMVNTGRIHREFRYFRDIF